MSHPAGDQASLVMSASVATCAVPIDRPVHIGQTVYREREYAALRLTSRDGSHGDAVAYTRGLPLQSMLERLAAPVVGSDPTRPAATVEALRAGNANSGAALVRALGLVDIALRDLAARRASLPLWRLLGGARARVPVTMVAGYHAAERGANAVLDEVRALLDDGARHIKLHSADVALVSAVAGLTRDRASLGVDLGMGFRTLPDALADCRQMDTLGLAFLEDVFPVEAWHLTADLAARLRTPLAAGEDALGEQALLDLLDGVLVLRVDATASGGFATALRAATVATTRGRRVMTHAFPDLHAHLAGDPAVGMVEMIPDASGVNPVGRLLARRQVVADGELQLSEEPGHGAPLDWDQVTRHATRMTTIEHGKD